MLHYESYSLMGADKKKTYTVESKRLTQRSIVIRRRIFDTLSVQYSGRDKHYYPYYSVLFHTIVFLHCQLFTLLAHLPVQEQQG